MDIRTLLLQIRAGSSDRQIHRDLGHNRRTIKKYREWAAEQGILDSPLPPIDEVHRLLEQTLPHVAPPQNTSSVEPYREIVIKLRREGVEIAALWERLKERGYTGSYSAVYRFVRALEPKTPEPTVRVECAPGDKAQVDFGYAGMMLDPDRQAARRTWAFVMTLSWSRHQYVEFVFDQKLATWLRLHRHAFEFFGGVPRRVVTDNLKSAIVRACWEKSEAQYAYAECAEHYGFLIAPHRPATPEHKGKVEQGGVHYVTRAARRQCGERNFLGGRTPTTITQANRDVRRWCLTTAGERTHGTTQEQPLRRFQETEQDRLQPLPDAPYDLAVWKVVKVHRDCHIVFEKSYYSVPFRLIGNQVRVRGGSREVRIYTLDYQLVATHDRAQRPGERHMHPAHLPPEKAAALVLTRDVCQTAATDIGPAAEAVVHHLLDDVVDRLPTVRRLLRLRERFGDARLEQACQRALRFDDPTYTTIKRILEIGLDAAERDDAPADEPGYLFVRSATELLGHLFGGVR